MHIFRTNIDIDKNEAKNFRLQNEIAFPSVVGTDKGFVFFHSGFNTFYGWDGTSWLNLGAGGTVPTLQQVTTAGNITTDTIQAASFQLDLAAGIEVNQGEIAWNADEETLDVGCNGAVLQVGQEMHVHVRNNTGVVIPDGTPVMATGTLGASGRITIAPMNNTGAVENHYFLGITTETIPDGDDGKISTFGKIRGIQTNGVNYGEVWVDGDLLYLSDSTIGALTKVPSTTGALRVPIAIVINSHASTGTIFVRVTIQDVVTGGAGTGLEAVDEGNGDGYRIVGMNADNYGPIGFGSVDFSQNGASTTFGARGLYGINYGNDNTQGIGSYYQFTAGDTNVTSNHYAVAWGSGNTASNYMSWAYGYQNTVPNPYSMAFGTFNNVQDYYSGAVGLGLDVQSPHSFFVGTGNTIYTNTSINQANTRLFGVGNGSVNAGAPNTVGTRSDAFLVFWDGRILAPSATLSVINNEATGKILTTKEWTDDRYLPKYLVNATVTGTYDIDWDYDTLRLTMTGATTFSDINLPTSGVNTKVLTIYMNGSFTPTWPAGWTTYVTGTYDGTVLNQIVVEFISTGVYWVTINRAD